MKGDVSIMSRLRSEPSLKIASLILAVFVWMYMRSETRPSQIFTVPIEYEGLPEDLALSGDFPDSVVVHVRAPDPTLKAIGPASFRARVRLAGLKPGEVEIPVKPDMIRAPLGIEVMRVEPATLSLTVERRIRRDVPVVARFKGKPAHGYENDGYTLNPDKVMIEGPEGVVRAVREAVTDKVDISGRKKSFETVVGVVPDRGGVRIVSEGAATLRVSIREERITRTFAGIPMTPNLPAGVSYEVSYAPEKVDVVLEGTRAALDAINNGNIRVMLDVEGMSPREAAYAVKPRVVIAPAELGTHIAVHSISEPTVNVRIGPPDQG